MHEERIQAKSKGGFRPCTTDSHHYLPVASNVLNRQFSIDNPTPTWVGDITYLPTKEGWLYQSLAMCMGFTTVVDCIQHWGIVLRTNMQSA